MAAAMANAVVRSLAPRQNDDARLSSDGDLPSGWVLENGRPIPFWYSRTGVIVKWSLFLGLFTILGLYLFIGYMHAKKRLRKGLRPLAYHRWLVSRHELARVDPRYAYAQGPGVGYNNYRPDYYGMQASMPPPPVYDPNAARPPVYDGPDGGNKAPSQWGGQPTHRPENDDYQAPPGPPPPAAVTATHTGSSNNPYRP